MTTITASMVKELRERTGLGMMDCKKALLEADGVIDKAIDDLRKASGLKAAKKAGRVASEGIVLSKVAQDGNFGVMVEINSETDFVARDESFLTFATEVLDQAFLHSEASIDALLAEGLEAAREALVQKIGENISVRRIERLQVDDADAGIIETYVHSNNRIAVLLALRGGDSGLGKDIAMHVAAVNPLVVSPEEVPEELLAKESEIYSAQARESGKPEEIIAKMINGRLKKYVAEVSLLEQSFVKNPDMTIKALLNEAGADVVSFVRYELGEGIKKEEVDFATEVAAQLENS
jgi:elongation factor Ts